MSVSGCGGNDLGWGGSDAVAAVVLVVKCSGGRRRVVWCVE